MEQTASLWLDEPYTPRPPLAADGTADVVVVGAGIAGLATAYALARQGASVVVLERDVAAGAASGRNAGFILQGVAENYVAACRRFGADRATRIWRFTVTNRILLQSLARREGIDGGLRWLGSELIAGDDAEWDEIRESARALGGHGIRVTLRPAHPRQRADSDAARRSERAACFEDDGEMHPVRFVRGLAAATERSGVAIHEGTAVSAVRPDGVDTARGHVRAGAVVVCANAFSEHLVRASRVRPVRGQALATAPLARRVFERPSYAQRGYRYWRQTAEGRVVVGGWRDLAFDEEVGEELATTPPIQSALDAFLAEHGIDAPVTHRWAGTMGFSHDGLPYAGRRSDGVYVNAGFTGHGNAFAIATGEVIASLVRLGRHPDADLFDPERA